MAHGTPKVEKEKHYVIASEHPQKPLSLTVKVAKPAEGEAGRDLGLFSGLPQGDQGLADPKNAVSVAASSGGQAPTSWRALDSKGEATNPEDNALPVPSMMTTRAGGALHPKVAAKVHASQEAAAGKDKASSILQSSGAQQVVSGHPALSSSKSSPLTSLPSAMTSVSGTPAHGPKHTWAAGHHLDQLQQAATSVAGGLPISSSGPSSHLPPHLLSSTGGPGSPLVSGLARSEAGPQRPAASSHQDTNPPPSAHLQTAQRNAGLPGKHAGMEPNQDLASKMAAEAQKHHQVCVII